MLAAPKRKVKVWAYPVLASVLIGIGYYICIHPYWLFVVLALGILVCVETVRERWSMRRLASSRSGESICTFVDSFDCHHTDTWVLRALYEELSRLLAINGHPFPVRADDRCCEKDLKIDPEDLAELAADAAIRAGRSMDDTEQNPFYGKVHTVRDLVSFLEHQPRLANAEGADLSDRVRTLIRIQEK
jgi:hypothetical protein